MGPHAMMPRDASEIEGASLDRSIVRRVGEFARPYRLQIVGFLAAIVAAALLGLVPPLVTKWIIDEAIPQSDRGQLSLLAGFAVAAAVADAALSLVERWLSARIGEGLIYDLRVRVFDHVQRLPVAFFTRAQTGALVSRLNNDVIGAQRALTGTLGSVVSNLVVLVTTVVAMAALEWRLTIFAIALLPAFLIPARRVGTRLQAISREQMERNARMNSTMTERFGVAGAMLVKLFGRHDDEADRFSDDAAGVRDTGVRSAVLSRIFFSAVGLVGALGIAFVYWWGGLLVIDGDIELGTLVALGVLVQRIYQPLTALTNARVDVMTAFVSFERVFEVLDIRNPITDRPGAIDLVDVRGEIDFDDVWFTYPTADDVSLPSLAGAVPDHDRSAGPVLRGVSAHVRPGELVAVVGPSGAGKTTLTSLLPRLYDVDSGAVRIDGHDVRDLTQATLRKAIGVVSQDPHLFHDTIAGNLRYARPDATDDELRRACEAARIHHVIAALPEGYDTVVGDRGYRLSGGEKQRLSIARMLLKDPAIVILDEATSHLDSENEAAVQAALAEALVSRTSLVIAHRLSTITSADQILVLDAGQIVESGPHDVLLDRGGLYADLYRTLVRAEPAAS
ncbi:MAG TPA: ABC transporter ATP-binding protein [Acidimicrobiales bacterium]|nr:ABC transporter ATP-binding protein [Acidimicrobiales bacterium]